VHELLVLVLAVILTAYLGVRYWRALLWSASQHRLSEATRELGDWIDGPQGEKSLHMVCALLRVCPRLERGSDRKVMAVRAYDAILAVAEKVSGGRGRGNLWIAAERKACAYFDAVLLDRRITQTSQWYAGQVSDVAS
jgi:acyl transferase domain-containing protein